MIAFVVVAFGFFWLGVNLGYWYERRRSERFAYEITKEAFLDGWERGKVITKQDCYRDMQKMSIN